MQRQNCSTLYLSEKQIMSLFTGATMQNILRQSFHDVVNTWIGYKFNVQSEELAQGSTLKVWLRQNGNK